MGWSKKREKGAPPSPEIFGHKDPTEEWKATFRQTLAKRLRKRNLSPVKNPELSNFKN